MMTMSIDDCKEFKTCFGNYENWDNSWHCKGCIISKECKEFQEEHKECLDQINTLIT